jgi:hypothetical protein
LAASRVANVEGRNGFGANLDGSGRLGGRQRLRVGHHRERQHGREQRTDGPSIS